MKRKVFTAIFIFITMLAVGISVSANNTEHPRMLIKESEFDEACARAATSPWRELKETGIEDANSDLFDPTVQSYDARCNAFTDAVSSAALAYILDSDNKETYKTKILYLLQYWKPNVIGNIYDGIYTMDGDNWSGSIPPATAFINSIVALDIIYPQLTEAEIAEAETVLKYPISKFNAHMETHQVAVYGARGAWAIYNDDEDALNEAWSGYLRYYNSYRTRDGVGVVGPGYSFWRFINAQRSAKQLLPILMYFGGYDDSFFKDAENKNYMEWMFGYLMPPSQNQAWVFGDSVLGSTYVRGNDPNQNHDSYTAFASNLYSETTGAYASWYLSKQVSAATGQSLVHGRLFNYLVLRSELTESKKPESRVFNDGGAWFYEDIDQPKSIAGVLWNPTISDGHSHKEVNAFNIAANGDLLVVNAGCNTWHVPTENGYSWDYINKRAISANTVLIDYDYAEGGSTIQDPSAVNDHQSKSGAGITQSILSEKVDYAQGDSGEALPNGKHIRNFALVKSTDNTAGYFVVMDNVTTDEADSDITVVLRPLSAQAEANGDGSYTWYINPENAKASNLNGRTIINNSTDFRIFPVREPDSIEMIDGEAAGSAGYYGLRIKSMLANYTSNENKESRSAMVMLPTASDTSAPPMTRFGNVDFNGIKIAHTDTAADYVIQSQMDGEKQFGGLAFDAENLLMRTSDGEVMWYLAENAEKFRAGSIGFESNIPITIYADGDQVQINCKNTTRITIYKECVKSAQINGKTLRCIKKGDGFLTVYVPKGENTLTLGDSADGTYYSDLTSIFNYDFEDLSKGDFSLSKGGVIETADGNNVYNLTAPSKDTFTQNTLFDSERSYDGNSYIRLRMKFPKMAHQTVIQFKSNGGFLKPIVEYQGTLKRYKRGTAETVNGFSFKENVWYTLMLVLKSSEDKYFFTITGDNGDEFKSEEYSFSETMFDEGKTIDWSAMTMQIQSQNQRTNSIYGTSTLYIDDVALYQQTDFSVLNSGPYNICSVRHMPDGNLLADIIPRNYYQQKESAVMIAAEYTADGRCACIDLYSPYSRQLTVSDNHSLFIWDSDNLFPLADIYDTRNGNTNNSIN